MDAAPSKLHSLGRDQTTRPTTVLAAPKKAASAGPIDTLDGQDLRVAQASVAVEGSASPQAIVLAIPNEQSPAGTQTTAAATPEAGSISCPPLPYNTSQAAHFWSDAHQETGGLAPTRPGGHTHDGTHLPLAAGGSAQPTATTQSTPRSPALAAATSPRTAMVLVTTRRPPLSGDQLPRDASIQPGPNSPARLAGQISPLATQLSSSKRDAPGVDEQGSQAPAIHEPTPTGVAPGLADPLLALAADVLDDLETVWIANTNRLRQLTRDVEDCDGEERGFGLTLDHPDVARLAALVNALDQAQQQATKNLTKRLKEHPLAPWLKAQKGVGDKQAARLLAAIGDPYYNSLHDRPRTVSELWAYCGYHVLRVGAQVTHDAHSRTGSDPALTLPAGQVTSDAQGPGASGSKIGHPDQSEVGRHGNTVGVAPKRARGQKANWSSTAKMRCYLIAESTMKQLKRDTCPPDEELGYAVHAAVCECSRYRKVYDAARAKYVDAVHAVECVRCGPKGKPAPAGSPLSRAHKQARALRAVSKELLKDLWREARRLHGIDDSP